MPKHLPIPVSVALADRCTPDDVLTRYNLTRNSYLFTANGISDIKDFPLIFSTWRSLIDKGITLDLVVAGRNRSWRPEYAVKYRDCELKYIGLIPNEHVLSLYKESALVINPCGIESPSRSSIEAMMVGARILLPPDVPEFANVSDIFIAKSRDPDVLALQATHILKNGLYPNYDVSAHNPTTVGRLYLEEFISLIE